MWHSGARMLAATNAPRSHRPAYDTSPSLGESSRLQCSARKMAFENSPSQFLHSAAVVMKITSSVSESMRLGVRAIASGTGWPVIGWPTWLAIQRRLTEQEKLPDACATRWRS